MEEVGDKITVREVDEPANVLLEDENRKETVLMDCEKLPFHIVDMCETYGEGERGACAKGNIFRSTIIAFETPLAYLAFPVEGEEGAINYFLRVPTKAIESEKFREMIPMELIAQPGGHYAALAGVLIRDHEKECDTYVYNPELCLHGRTDSNRCLTPQQAYDAVKILYLKDKDTETKWTLEEFTKVYAVVQTNSILFRIPCSFHIYGIGFCPGLCFFNHSCTPNAIIQTIPGKVFVHALRDIEVGEEITIAYREIPNDLLSWTTVKVEHFEMGLNTEHGCRCALCNETQRAADMTIFKEIDATKKILIDLTPDKMWMPDTAKLLQLDTKLMAYVDIMTRHSDLKARAAAAHAIRMEYDHILTYPPARQTVQIVEVPGDGPNDPPQKKEIPHVSGGPEDNPSFRADLAYILGGIYIKDVIHYPGQDTETYYWWTDVYLNVITTSKANLPNAFADACIGVCQACFYAMQRRMVDLDRVKACVVPDELPVVTKQPVDRGTRKKTGKKKKRNVVTINDSAVKKDDDKPEDTVVKQQMTGKTSFTTKEYEALEQYTEAECKKDVSKFVSSWVSLRTYYQHMFDGIGYVANVLYAYPALGKMSVNLKNNIMGLERQLALGPHLAQALNGSGDGGNLNSDVSSNPSPNPENPEKAVE